MSRCGKHFSGSRRKRNPHRFQRAAFICRQTAACALIQADRTTHYRLQSIWSAARGSRDRSRLTASVHLGVRARLISHPAGWPVAAARSRTSCWFRRPALSQSTFYLQLPSTACRLLSCYSRAEGHFCVTSVRCLLARWFSWSRAAGTAVHSTSAFITNVHAQSICESWVSLRITRFKYSAQWYNETVILWSSDPQVSNTRPAGQIRPATSFFVAPDGL